MRTTALLALLLAACSPPGAFAPDSGPDAGVDTGSSMELALVGRWRRDPGASFTITHTKDFRADHSVEHYFESNACSPPETATLGGTWRTTPNNVLTLARELNCYPVNHDECSADHPVCEEAVAGDYLFAIDGNTLTLTATNNPAETYVLERVP